jgi:uncharacterized protein YjbJ (UPF0337 family)
MRLVRALTALSHRCTHELEDARMADYERDKELRAKKDMRERGLENQAKGRIKEVEGKIRGAAADAFDDTSEEAKAKAKELEGKAQKNFGKIQEELDDAV